MLTSNPQSTIRARYSDSETKVSFGKVATAITDESTIITNVNKLFAIVGKTLISSGMTRTITQEVQS